MTDDDSHAMYIVGRAARWCETRMTQLYSSALLTRLEQLLGQRTRIHLQRERENVELAAMALA